MARRLNANVDYQSKNETDKWTQELVDYLKSSDDRLDTAETDIDVLQNYRKNVIINGNFDVWQRGTSFTSLISGYTADRFEFIRAGAAVVSALRSTDVPTYAESSLKSNYSLHIDVTTADASLAAGDYASIRYKIEGYDYAQLAGGDATLSFWVKGSKTGTHCVGFLNGGVDRSYVAEYTINAVDTWEKKTITVPLTETNGTWDYTNGIGLYLWFALASGTTFQTTPNAWQTGLYFATSGQVNEMDSAANNFRIDQVQFEKGGTATPFEFRQISGEVPLCQRYYEKSYGLSVDPGTVTFNGSITELATRNTAAGTLGYRFKVEKRATPTVTIYSPVTGASGQVANNGDKAAAAVQINTSGFRYVSITAGTTAFNADVHLVSDAEL